jgi:hypothetical protein
VSDKPAGDGKIGNPFLQCRVQKKYMTIRGYSRVQTDLESMKSKNMYICLQQAIHTCVSRLKIDNNMY